ncbi:hypothetical protein B0J12DRAFT_298803 [Macrophomina phaseolina]|uniref:Uncharacterized protein n=1 Tax=Macrophomina phaseolina TaxID=35725 RepID=A0ABQ8GP46_9PEZI|nr:hypothetical protein B0J12DRAFT_298803 [Macrophomina phaseolina]
MHPGDLRPWSVAASVLDVQLSSSSLHMASGDVIEVPSLTLPQMSGPFPNVQLLIPILIGPILLFSPRPLVFRPLFQIFLVDRFHSFFFRLASSHIPSVVDDGMLCLGDDLFSSCLVFPVPVCMLRSRIRIASCLPPDSLFLFRGSFPVLIAICLFGVRPQRSTCLWDVRCGVPFTSSGICCIMLNSIREFTDLLFCSASVSLVLALLRKFSYTAMVVPTPVYTAKRGSQSNDIFSFSISLPRFRLSHCIETQYISFLFVIVPYPYLCSGKSW